MSPHRVPRGHQLKSGKYVEPTLEYVKSLDQFTEEGKDEIHCQNRASVTYNDAEKRTNQIHEKKKKRKKNST